MKLHLFIDWGNILAKTLAVLGDLGGEVTPTKQPSLIREIEGDSIGIAIAGCRSQFVFGDEALRVKGRRYSTLEQRSKIKRLAIVVAHLVHQAIPEAPKERIVINLVVSNPFSTTQEKAEQLARDVAQEVEVLTKGFTVNGQKYKVSFDKVGTLPEGLGLLECDRSYNGVIDFGSGTILAGYRHPYDGIISVPQTGGNEGGCNQWISALLNDGDFLREIAAKGFTGPPSEEKLCKLLGDGRWDVKGVEFAPHLHRYVNDVLIRLENACHTLRSALELATPDGEVIPRFALVGGGAAMLERVLTPAQKATLSKCFGLEIFSHLPDFQTVLILHQLFKLDSSRFKTFKALMSDRTPAGAIAVPVNPSGKPSGSRTVTAVEG